MIVSFYMVDRLCPYISSTYHDHAVQMLSCTNSWQFTSCRWHYPMRSFNYQRTALILRCVFYSNIHSCYEDVLYSRTMMSPTMKVFDCVDWYCHGYLGWPKCIRVEYGVFRSSQRMCGRCNAFAKKLNQVNNYAYQISDIQYFKCAIEFIGINATSSSKPAYSTTSRTSRTLITTPFDCGFNYLSFTPSHNLCITED